MLNARARCWNEDALFAVSIALYLYLALGAVQAWAHLDQVSRAASQLLHSASAAHSVVSLCR